MVRDSDRTQWIKNYFAGISENGKPLVWYGGKTSWTSAGISYEWRYCRRPTPEELAK